MSLSANPNARSLRLSGWAMGLLFVGAGASQLKLQTMERGNTLALADETKRFNVSRKDHAKRGSILAADNRALAVDEDAYELNVRFDQVPHSEAFFLALAQATGIPASEFQSLAAAGLRSRAWRQPVSQAQAEAVNKVRADWRASGVSLARVDRRAYPLAEAASGLVGLLRDETGAVLGLEKSQDELLSGVDGFRKGLTDKRGAFLPMRLAQETKDRTDGNTLQLTIDTELQIAASMAIRKAVDENKADNGVALVMDPKTGDILASANWPSYRPYQADGTPGPIAPGEDYNPAIMAQLEPGSTFKILTLAKGLETGDVRSGEFLHCGGSYKPWRRGRAIHCDMHHGNRAHGTVSIDTAIAKSCNVAAASWARRVGYDDFLAYIKDLGLLKRSTLGIPGELRGSYNFNEPNKQLQLATFGFGQSLTCTPVGLIGAFGMLANEGVRMEPRLIKRVGNQEQPLAEGKQVVSAATAQRVLNTMEAVIETDAGTGKTLRVPGYRLGGKTGTAEKVGQEKGYVSNFIGFVPAQAPKAVILVMVNNPKAGKYYGATVAGPAFKTMAEAVIRRYSLPPTEPIVPTKKPITH
jgi:cell division protein FtsI/penicillin-binding protein 2